MNVSSIIVLALTTTLRANAFSPIHHSNNINILKSLNQITTIPPPTTLKLFFADEAEKVVEVETTDNTEAKSDDDNNAGDEIELMAGSSGSSVESMTGSIYDKLGFQEKQIALGIEPDEVSKHKEYIITLIVYIALSYSIFWGVKCSEIIH